MLIKKVHADFETQASVDLKKTGAYEYSKHHETRAMCFAFKHPSWPRPKLIPYRMIELPWNALPLSVREPWQRWALDPEIVFVAHNATFEQCIYNNVLVPLGWPVLPIEKWRCTAAKAAAVAIPRNLAGAGAVMQTHTQKDFEGHRIMLRLCKPTAAYIKWEKKVEKLLSAWAKTKHHLTDAELRAEVGDAPPKFWTPETAPDDFKKLYHYCKIDVLAEELLDKALPDLPPTEQALWFIDQKINLRGVRIDMPLVEKVFDTMRSESKAMVKELDVLTMGLVSSGHKRKAILDFLEIEGIALPNLRSATVAEFIANGKVTGDAKAVLKIRQALSKSSTAKYQSLINTAASDGRVRDILLFNAASTGRWGGKGVQPQNLPRGGIIKDIYSAIDDIKTLEIEDLKMLYGRNLMPLFSSVIRGVFIASEGYEMFVQDYAGVELRVLWWLARHEKGLAMLKNGIDPYRAMASRIFNVALEEVTDAQRQVGKAAVLGCGFGMGAKKFITSAKDVYRADVTKDLAKLAVSAYREEHWPVAELWSEYDQAAMSAVEYPSANYRVGLVSFRTEGRFLKITLPSGRKLSYCDPKLVWRENFKMLDKDDDMVICRAHQVKAYEAEGYNVVKTFQLPRLEYFAVNHQARKEDCVIPKWAREATYGGKITENIVQAVARDLLANAIVQADIEGFDVLMHSHDELVCEAPKNVFSERHYQLTMESLPTWAAGLPLKAEGWKNTRYRK